MKRVAIIGAGLAGTSCAYVLKRYGLEPAIYEAGAEIAPGASGNPVGLYNPRLSASRSPESDFYAGAFALALRTFAAMKGIEWNKCGSLHLMSDEKRAKRFEQCARNWGWPEENLRIVNATQASDIAGVEIAHGALWLPDAGVVSPKKLCERYAQGVEIHLNAKINSLGDVKADAVILACGAGARYFTDTKDLSIKSVRGQITFIRAAGASENLKCNLCYGGYMSPAAGGVHALGATFQRWLDHSEILPEDDADNLTKLAQAVPAIGRDFEVTGHRASARAAADGHFPVAGKITDGIYFSLAHGSHGILSSIAAAHLIADLILRGPLSFAAAAVKKLSPARFGEEL